MLDLTVTQMLQFPLPMVEQVSSEFVWRLGKIVPPNKLNYGREHYGENNSNDSRHVGRRMVLGKMQGIRQPCSLGRRGTKLARNSGVCL